MTPPRLVSVAETANAAESVRRAKGRGGMAGFGVTALGSYLHDAALFDLLLRSLAGGVVAYVLVWWAAVTIWRLILVGDGKRRVQEALEKRRAATAARP